MLQSHSQQPQEIQYLESGKFSPGLLLSTTINRDFSSLTAQGQPPSGEILSVNYSDIRFSNNNNNPGPRKTTISTGSFSEDVEIIPDDIYDEDEIRDFLMDKVGNLLLQNIKNKYQWRGAYTPGRCSIVK